MEAPKKMRNNSKSDLDEREIKNFGILISQKFLDMTQMDLGDILKIKREVLVAKNVQGCCSLCSDM